ncbi:MAG: hypothetical protein WBV77_17010, partial [Solirubrobacteraceae bacterium]
MSAAIKPARQLHYLHLAPGGQDPRWVVNASLEVRTVKTASGTVPPPTRRGGRAAVSAARSWVRSPSVTPGRHVRASSRGHGIPASFRTLVTRAETRPGSCDTSAWAR